jgi:hypothetical protein
VTAITPFGPAVLAARLPPPADITHASLYETCAALIIAVIVVLYFDERVRRDMPPRQRGHAIGWLGGILAVGVINPLLVLGGFVGDTSRVRAFTVGYTALFLTGAFGVAISAWGREDGRRLRAAQAPPPVPPVPPVPVPGAHLSERERAAEVLGYAFTAVAFAATTSAALTGHGPPSPASRALARELMRQWADRWTALAPALAAIAVGYPSPQVREHVRAYMEAGGRVLLAAATIAAAGDPPGGEAPGEPAGSAGDELAAAAAEEQAIIRALHPDDGARRPSVIAGSPSPRLPAGPHAAAARRVSRISSRTSSVTRSRDTRSRRSR